MVPQMLSRHRMNTPSAQPNLITLPSGTFRRNIHYVNSSLIKKKSHIFEFL